jgi:hypothetical protein
MFSGRYNYQILKTNQIQYAIQPNKEAFALYRFPESLTEKGRTFRLKIFFGTTHKPGI